MYSPGKTTDFPFSLSEADGIYSSGQSGVISAYFKPRRDGNFEVEVIFEVDEGREKNLKLMGRGIEQKLKIRGGNISFFPAIPGVTSEEREFSIKNVSRSPLEFGWQHLDEVEVLEERIMRVLTHYYGSKEILLPVRQLGIDLHEKIYKFYDELVEEMKSNFSTDAITSQDAASQNEENFLKFDRNSEGMEDLLHAYSQLQIYRQKVTEKKDEIAREEKEKLLLKLKDIDEMSLPEFEKLGEEDKNLFIEKVQRPRIEEARLRRKKFKEKMSKSETEEQPPLKSPSSSSQVQQLSSLSSAPDKPKKFSKKTKDTAKGKKSSGEIQINKKEEEIERTSRRDQEEKFSKDQPIAEAMDLYTKNLNTIATMIDDKSNIWLIAFSDPWDRKNYLFIIDQIGHNTSKKKFETKEIHFSSPEIEEQIFSIYGYNQIKRYFKPLSDEVPFEINNVDGNPMNSRTVLHPNGTKRFKVVFNPQKTGEFSYNFVLHIIGNNNQMHRINLSGIGDIPRLNMDPKFIFPNIKGKKTNEIHDPTFFVDTKTFDFGFLLTPKDKETKIHHKTSRFSFVNCSLINVDVQFSLTSESSKIFSLDKSSASISPGEKETLKIIASAPQLGSNTDKLFISIINNPQVEEIFLKSSGCNLDIEIDRRTINFGRILLYRKDCRRVTLRNKSPVRLFWKIMDLFNYESGINSQLSFSSSSGLIEPLNEINFNVYFDGQVVGIIDKQSIPVGFFLFKNDKEYLLIENIIILAEVYDIFLEVNGTNPIDLGIIKIGEKTSKGFSLKNRGQYNINFKYL
ncbi:hydrocephalus-inducing protein homolog [Fopius arisanus]|uniref:Hydrocephalus-inducing protein homolog n=1 Tax=Fopius arisanus TaxID=64838 RepID=A0A9R1TJY4_9HYME|nr:PREDICTED: hydrocephalus-inducing protein homolog [Fopius arisanus]